MYAIFYKEWIKTRWYFLLAVLATLGFTGYCMLRINRVVEMKGAAHVWEVMLQRDVIFIDMLQYIPLIAGILMAIVQFVPEMQRKCLKLTLHLPYPELKMTVFIQDGAEVKKGDIAFVVEGKIQSLLQTERLMLNVMQRMSGIATTTRKYAKALEGTKTHVLDTRKTTPGMRMIEKEAVRIGGGMNHRIGLFDMILLKDNHVDFAGGIEQAITRAQNYLKEKGKNLKIEIEVRNFDELEQAMKVGGIDRIMLDNFNIENTKEAVRRINGRFEVESSGGITFDTLRDYAECGVDFISVGALTHSVKSLDMSFKAC